MPSALRKERCDSEYFQESLFSIGKTDCDGRSFLNGIPLKGFCLKESDRFPGKMGVFATFAMAPMTRIGPIVGKFRVEKPGPGECTLRKGLWKLFDKKGNLCNSIDTAGQSWYHYFQFASNEKEESATVCQTWDERNGKPLLYLFTTKSIEPNNEILIALSPDYATRMGLPSRHVKIEGVAKPLVVAMDTSSANGISVNQEKTFLGETGLAQKDVVVNKSNAIDIKQHGKAGANGQAAEQLSLAYKPERSVYTEDETKLCGDGNNETHQNCVNLSTDQAAGNPDVRYESRKETDREPARKQRQRRQNVPRRMGRPVHQLRPALRGLQSYATTYADAGTSGCAGNSSVKFYHHQSAQTADNFIRRFGQPSHVKQPFNSLGVDPYATEYGNNRQQYPMYGFENSIRTYSPWLQNKMTYMGSQQSAIENVVGSQHPAIENGVGSRHAANGNGVNPQHPATGNSVKGTGVAHGLYQNCAVPTYADNHNHSVALFSSDTASESELSDFSTDSEIVVDVTPRNDHQGGSPARPVNEGSDGSEAQHHCTDKETKPGQHSAGDKKGVCDRPYPLPTANGKLEYRCRICNKEFGQLSNLKAHLRIHTGEKPYHCSYCSKSFTQLAHKQKHEMVHTGQRPYVCEACSKGFTSASNLKSHQNCHLNENVIYQCTECMQQYLSLLHMQVHRETHNGNRCYKCPTCNKKFMTKNQLSSHWRTETCLENSDVGICIGVLCGEDVTVYQGSEPPYYTKDGKLASCVQFGNRQIPANRFASNFQPLQPVPPVETSQLVTSAQLAMISQLPGPTTGNTVLPGASIGYTALPGASIGNTGLPGASRGNTVQQSIPTHARLHAGANYWQTRSNAPGISRNNHPIK